MYPRDYRPGVLWFCLRSAASAEISCVRSTANNFAQIPIIFDMDYTWGKVKTRDDFGRNLIQNGRHGRHFVRNFLCAYFDLEMCFRQFTAKFFFCQPKIFPPKNIVVFLQKNCFAHFDLKMCFRQFTATNFFGSTKNFPAKKLSNFSTKFSIFPHLCT